MNHLNEIKLVVKFVPRAIRLIFRGEFKLMVARLYRIRMAKERRLFSEKNSLKNRASQLKP